MQIGENAADTGIERHLSQIEKLEPDPVKPPLAGLVEKTPDAKGIENTDKGSKGNGDIVHKLGEHHVLFAQRKEFDNIHGTIDRWNRVLSFLGSHTITIYDNLNPTYGI